MRATATNRQRTLRRSGRRRHSSATVHVTPPPEPGAIPSPSGATRRPKSQPRTKLHPSMISTSRLRKTPEFSRLQDATRIEWRRASGKVGVCRRCVPLPYAPNLRRAEKAGRDSDHEKESCRVAGFLTCWVAEGACRAGVLACLPARRIRRKAGGDARGTRRPRSNPATSTFHSFR